MSKKALLGFIGSAALITINASEPSTTTKAAFDLGSGKFKLLVAEVQEKNIQVKFSKLLSVELGADLAESEEQTLSDDIQKKALDSLKELKKNAEEYGATHFQGIATAVFRKAKNGDIFLQNLIRETGLDLEIISQEKEGLLGFYTAAALCPDLKEENMISWDSGNASFQIVTKIENGYEVYEGPVGNSSVAKVFIEEVRKEPFTKKFIINPMTLQECDLLIKLIQSKISPPNWLQKKISDSNISTVALGDKECIFAIAARRIGASTYSKDQVKEVIEKMAGLSSQDLRSYVTLANPETALTRVILLYAVMEKFNIQEISYKEATGNTLGLLISP